MPARPSIGAAVCRAPAFEGDVDIPVVVLEACEDVSVAVDDLADFVAEVLLEASETVLLERLEVPWLVEAETRAEVVTAEELSDEAIEELAEAEDDTVVVVEVPPEELALVMEDTVVRGRELVVDANTPIPTCQYIW